MTTHQKSKKPAPKCLRYLWLTILLMCGATAFTIQESLSVSNIQVSSISNTSQTIILDAGHGGEDGGAVSVDGALEKDINLAIALKLRSLLEASGIQVVMIRDSDTDVADKELETVRERKVSDLHNRLKLAESIDNGILVSIHQNHFSESQYYGTQIFYSPNTPESQELAEAIRGPIIEMLQPENTRECKAAGSSIYLLWNSTHPAIIAECGFLSNPSEAKKLQDPEYQTQMAFAIWKGILDFLDRSESSDSFS